MNNVKPFREDIIEKVTGRAMYAADFIMPHMLYAKMLWPKYPSAKILKIDTSKAELLPGVERVITRKDITGTNLTEVVYYPYDRPVLVGEGEEVRFLSDALAVVVAETEEVACEAMDKIEVDYEVKPGIYTLEEAIKNTEPFNVTEIKKGNIEEAFSQSEVIVEDEYYIPFNEHAYLEPESGYAYLDELGNITLCYGTQNIMRSQRMICKPLGLPFSKVRVQVPLVGGGFGGKHDYSIQPYLVLATYLTKKPVKLTWTREESFCRSGKRHSIRARAKLGVDKEGKILGIKAELYTPGGPYRNNIHKTFPTAVKYVLGAYWIENMDLIGKIYKTNYSGSTAFRGYGATEGTFIIETLIDKAASKLNISPIEIRKKNILKEGQVSDNYPGSEWHLVSGKVTANETLQKVLDAAGQKPKAREGKRVGRGITVSMPMFGFGNTPGGYYGTGVDLTLFHDGTIHARIGFPEVGQGITGVVTRLISNSLGIPEDRISMSYADTHKGPKSASLGFSQGTVLVGNATLMAIQNLKSMMKDTAKKYLKTIEDIEFKEGGFYIGDKPCLDLEEFLEYCYMYDRNMTVSGWFEGAYFPENRSGVTFMSGLVDVEVDDETGELKVLQVVTCHDIGKVIHPISARGQIIGGAVMAMGLAMTEEFIYENGNPITPSFTEYIVPTAKDIPLKNIDLYIECPGKDCPLGAKGLGEHALYTFQPALANAIFDATGVSITKMPINPENMLRAMKKI